MTTKLTSFVVTCLALLAITSTVAQAQESSPPAGIEAGKLGETKNVHSAGSLYFSGQFSESGIAALKQANITRVISLRTEEELEWNEQAAVENAGLEFVRVPFKSPETMTDDVFMKVRKLLADSSKSTLLHCKSGNRVGGVWLAYRVLDEGVDFEKATTEAKVIGLKKPFVIERATAYIRANQSAGMGGEQSVKPGINKGFKDPELNVEKMVARFELESREVYLARNQIVEACEIKPGTVVADVGAGTGLFSRLFSDAVGGEGWVYAVDIAPRMIAHVVKDVGKTGKANITGVVCAENSINLPPNSVDLVFICDTYHHFEFPRSSLASIFKALRPGGRVVVVDFERIEGTTRDWLMNHVRAGKQVFRAEIKDAGFDFVEEKPIDEFKENYFLVFKKPK